MKKKILIITIIVATLLTSLVACNKGKGNKADYAAMIKKSSETATEMNGTLTVTDGGVVMYKYAIGVVMKNGGAAVTTSESQYNSNFVFDTRDSFEEYETYDRSNLIKINYDENKLKATVSGDTVNITVSAANFASVMNTGAYAPAGDATIVLTCSGDTVRSIVCNYSTATGKNVKVEYTYKY